MNANKLLLAFCSVFLLLTASCAYLGNSVPEVTDSEFATLYRKDLAKLSSDDFEGRLPGTPGGEKTVNYLVESFKSMGLEPGNHGSYLQEVKLIANLPMTKTNTTISSKNSSLELKPLTHMLSTVTGEAGYLEFLDKELVFVGFGAVAPDYDWDDYDGVDVEGKIVVILRSDPGFASGDTTFFNGSDGGTHNSFSTKYALAGSHGAAGAIVIIDPKLSKSTYTWQQRKGLYTAGKNILDDGTIDTSAALLNAMIDIDIGKEMLKLAGYDYDSLLVAAYTRGFQSIDLELKLNGEYTVDIKRYSSYNVLALLPGTKRPDEVIIYTAHWDHIGMDKNLEGDQIYNGAADNATGTAAILNLARSFLALPNGLDRSVLFLSFTAEEMNLLGSEYYANNPVFPLEKSVAALNIDMLKFVDPTNDIIVYGLGKSELDDYAAKAAKKQGMHIVAQIHPGENIYFRSDHINLARKGLPAIFMDMGVESREHGREWGMTHLDEFVQAYYHSVSDEYNESLNVDGIMQYLQVAFDVGYTLANSNKFPNWKIDDDFRPLRDEMMKAINTMDATP